jgi:hypothetical protein
MDEFDIDVDINSDIGTYVSKIKNTNPNNGEIKQSETEFDYDKAMEILYNSETNNSYHNNKQNKLNGINPNNDIISYSTNNSNSYIKDVIPKKEININNMVRNIESNIDNHNRNIDNHNRNIESNIDNHNINIESNIDNHNRNIFSNNISNQNLKMEKNSQILPVQTIKMNNPEHINIINETNDTDKCYIFTKILRFEYLHFFIYVFSFILLNNPVIIKLIYDRVPYINIIKSPYPNLILRSLFFGILLLLIKKYNI